MKYGVICYSACGSVELTTEQYNEQMDKPNARWRCPKCGGLAEFDDDLYEESLEALEQGT